MRRYTCSKPRAGLDRRGSKTRSCKGACLKDAAKLLRKPLRPAASQRSVVIDVNERTEGNGPVAELGVNQDESLTVLITRGVEILVIGGGELPVDEHGECMPIRLRIRSQSLRQHGGGHCRIGPEFNRENVAGIVPRRRRIYGSVPQGRAWNHETFQHRETPCCTRGASSPGVICFTTP